MTEGLKGTFREKIEKYEKQRWCKQGLRQPSGDQELKLGLDVIHGWQIFFPKHVK